MSRTSIATLTLALFCLSNSISPVPVTAQDNDKPKSSVENQDDKPSAKPDTQPTAASETSTSSPQPATRAPDATSVLEVRNAILKTLESTTVAAQTAGIISALDVKEGYTVKPGQELARIRDTAVRLQVERAKAAADVALAKQKDDIDVRLATKSLAVAENEYQRAVKANSRVPDTYPINEIDRLKLVADRARLEVERAAYLKSMAALEGNIADTEYRQSLELQDRHRIQALVSGVVVSIEKHVGEWVEPGTPILKIERIDRLRVEGFVPAADATRKIVGQNARVAMTLSTGTVETQGRVVFVSPSIDPILSTARVFIEIDNTEAMFRPGLTVSAHIQLP